MNLEILNMAKLKKPTIWKGPASHYAAPLEIIREISGNDGNATGLLVSVRWINADTDKRQLLVSLYSADGPIVVSLGEGIDLHPKRDQLFAIRAENGEA